MSKVILYFSDNSTRVVNAEGCHAAVPIKIDDKLEAILVKLNVDGSVSGHSSCERWEPCQMNY